MTSPSSIHILNDISLDVYEQLGTKEKFWFYFNDNPHQQYLFKHSRHNTGEHWSEKVAEQLCILMGIPHANYSIAEYEGRLGVYTENLIPKNATMIMGNEALFTHDPLYPSPTSHAHKYDKVSKHTIANVIHYFENTELNPPPCSNPEITALDYFCGYLLLDAVISNQDRHHENWAIMIDSITGNKYLCPTYDHAASLGRELRETDKKERLETSDTCRQVKTFVKKARSALYLNETDKKPLFTTTAFYEATLNRDQTRDYWLERLKLITEKSVQNILGSISNEIFSPVSKQFALEMILANKQRLIEYDPT